MLVKTGGSLTATVAYPSCGPLLPASPANIFNCQATENGRETVSGTCAYMLTKEVEFPGKHWLRA